MLRFKEYINEARIYEPKYVAGDPFTLNHRTPNAVHKALKGGNYQPGSVFTKSIEEPTIVYGKGNTSVTLEDEKGNIIKVSGTKSSLNAAFNKGDGKGGGTMQAADWEEVITIAHNMSLDDQTTIDEAATAGDIKLPIKPKILSKINGKVNHGKNIVDKVKLPEKIMKHYGRGTGSPSTLWKKTFKDADVKMNPKSMTPKTDMYIGDMRISLKQSGGSQLMSGYKGDTMGVLAAAYNKAIKDREGQAELLEGLKQTFNYMYDDVKNNFSKSQDVGAGSKEITKKAKKIKETGKGKLDDIEKAVMETVQKGKAVQTHVRQIMEQHPLVKKYAVEEAMTGNMKFSDITPKSNWLMVFSPDGAGTHIDKIDNKLVDTYASKVSWSVGFKSAGGRGALSLRGILQDEYEPTTTMKQIISEAWDEIGEDRIYLSEGLWDKVKDTAKRASNWVKEKALKVLKMLWDKIVNKILTLLQNGFEWIKKIFGWQPVLKSVSNPYFV